MGYPKGNEIQLYSDRKRKDLILNQTGVVYRIIDNALSATKYVSSMLTIPKPLRHTIGALVVGCALQFAYDTSLVEKTIESIALYDSVPAVETVLPVATSAIVPAVLNDREVVTSVNTGLQSMGPSPVPVLIGELFPVCLQEIAAEGFTVPNSLSTASIKNALAIYHSDDYALDCLGKGLLYGVLSDGTDELFLSEAIKSAVHCEDWRTAELASFVKGDIESSYLYATRLARGPIIPKTEAQYVNEILNELEKTVEHSNRDKLRLTGIYSSENFPTLKTSQDVAKYMKNIKYDEHP